jgi:fibro-slime domain-containing protein
MASLSHRTALAGPRFLCWLGMGLVVVACSSTDGDDGRDTNPRRGTGGILFDPVPNPTSHTDGDGSTSDPAFSTTLPPGFTKTDKGGMKLGEPLPASGVPPGSSSDGGMGDGCGTTLLAVVRDFHPDGKNFEGSIYDDRGLADPQLGADDKPDFVKTGATKTTSGSAALDQFYHDVAGVNRAYLLKLWFEPNDGVLTFHSNAFFPLDGSGFGNEGNNHDFHFTTELHTAFEYRGGEKFEFLGDDDLWVFVNRKLAIDLGGVHGAEGGSIDIDARARELGIVKGKIYSLDLFHAERHTTQSNFRVDTDLAFVDCGTIVPDIR